ncbi:methylmalonyl-CoA mutase family protein [Paenibacillus sp. LHD-117]|uniref:fused isobutyryl-CoA mutase/GTPase IcmF n=1 Tax=Paenibacillus sp. LHD-117 TaxID=3071412 RepID=UPI0027DFC71E|nr:fused isobutyryl-CoA mutase/GTPase IcmF [Paenibacillus sp. LHD-117]MDQ6421561.1 methylmalonyl-CoA mutase family protein [Paenibacillus sp. LHD-117]
MDKQAPRQEPMRPARPIRFVTASSLFDGHDASINMIRRLLQAAGAEVIHLGHNRSAEEIVLAAVQEDAQAIAVSSYQGGHVEFLSYMADLLREWEASHIRIFAGGGGVIIPAEAEYLEKYGIAKIFTPEDGRTLGLEGMIGRMLRESDYGTPRDLQKEQSRLRSGHPAALARLVTTAEERSGDEAEAFANMMADIGKALPRVPVIGMTGTGGAGKSSLTDELVRRYLRYSADGKVAVISIDPTKMKTGGALLGDRIRMNAIGGPRTFMRSMATRGSGKELSGATKDAVDLAKAAGFDWIFVETSGIGQGDSAVSALCDISVYVMTSEYGAPSQLEKIDMLDYADLIVINKFERLGSEDALRDVRKQYRRSRGGLAGVPNEELPVFGTIASRFNDPGTTALFSCLADAAEKLAGSAHSSAVPETSLARVTKASSIIPRERIGYLGEISHTVRERNRFIEEQAELARNIDRLRGARTLTEDGSWAVLPEAEARGVAEKLDAMAANLEKRLHPECRALLEGWPSVREAYGLEREAGARTRSGGKEISEALYSVSLAGLRIPRISLPRYSCPSDVLRWLLTENLPGSPPYTAGVFPLKRRDEEPKRQFAGEGTPDRTNRRFHYLSRHDDAKRLSVAFDSVTLYGQDPGLRPDIYGKIGNSGVSVCTLDDMEKLFRGFDLCNPSTSVSMTINGPAPIVLAMFMNAAIRQQIGKFAREHGREPNEAETGQLRAWTLRTVRGTVQADILKEDQGQNTCIFSTEFALKMMGDIQQYFIDRGVRHYYSVSISGYHIAEAGANPISQLAFTLANGFTYVEYYLSRGMAIDDFAPNLSFFFSNGLDPEYAVMGRVARRIWSTVIKHKYKGNERSQKLKYHIQTSGRSLHAQEMDFNDIRTTLQALLAIYDNCNSLHTNAYDEAITTPTEHSVRRAMAIQMIINKEFGLARNENPLQGSFVIEELTDLVEEAVLAEFDRIHQRGGVLGAMDTGYQRGRIQEESLLYEGLKHSGELPIVGVNMFLNPHDGDILAAEPELARSTDEEKATQLANLKAFQLKHEKACTEALERLRKSALAGGNLFEELMETVQYASLGQITAALFEVGGQYRRNM